MLNTRTGENYNANDVINPNDLRKRLINVDSRFRSNASDPTTAFTFNVEHTYKNLIRLRIASIEIPNMNYVFTKNNNSFIIKAYDITNIVRSVQITIKEGNYTSAELMAAIQDLFDSELRDPYGIFMTIELDTITARVTITNNGVSAYPVVGPTPAPTNSAQPFILDFVTSAPISMRKRKQNFGLGYNLGFRNHLYKVTNSKLTTVAPILTTYYQTAEACLDVVGDTYMLLSVNDYYNVEQKTDSNYIQCIAKIIVREEKYTVIYDDGSTLLSNDIVFPSPTDLKILQVKLLDPYGEIIDLCGMNFSFSLEITEVLNTKLYDFYRNYIWLGTIPSVNYKTVQGSPQPLLRGIGPPW
jgi:hypothetical protein